MWVTHENLKRAKGGRPRYEAKLRTFATCAGALPASVALRLASRASA
jgi:hypothetical protein